MTTDRDQIMQDLLHRPLNPEILNDPRAPLFLRDAEKTETEED